MSKTSPFLKRQDQYWFSRLQSGVRQCWFRALVRRLSKAHKSVSGEFGLRDLTFQLELFNHCFPRGKVKCLALLMWVLGRSCQGKLLLPRSASGLRQSRCAKLREKWPQPSPTHWRGKSSWPGESQLWNIKTERQLWGTEQQLRTQMGVRTGHIPELSKGF